MNEHADKIQEYVTLIDGNGEKYEVIGRSNKIITVKNPVGMVFNIPSNYLMDYDIWCKKNKVKI